MTIKCEKRCQFKLDEVYRLPGTRCSTVNSIKINVYVREIYDVYMRSVTISLFFSGSFRMVSIIGKNIFEGEKELLE